MGYSVTNPATGERVQSFETLSDPEVANAIAGADAAYRDWAVDTSVLYRADLIRRVADLHDERRQQLAETMTIEMGKPIDLALDEVDFATRIYRFFADNAATALADQPITLEGGTGSAILRRSALGVLLGVMPWNFPLYQVARFAAPNLIVGNTILLKHAAQCPLSAAMLDRIFTEAGFPRGAYTNLYASHSQLALIIEDERVQGVSLTGSERAGARIAEIAGRNLKKVVLELGGSDPFILLSTDDLACAVDAAVAARLDNGGQSCTAAKRFIIVDELYDEFVAAFTEKIGAIEAQDPTRPGVTLGPMSSLQAAEHLEQQVSRAVANGATLARGGVRADAYFSTTVLTDITPENPASQEEFFGPVAQMYRARDEDDAVRIANNTPFGLGCFLFTTDDAQAMRVADRIESGMVYINVVLAESAELPFGGVKRSGFGRELGKLGFDEFVNKKLIRIGVR